MGKGVGLGAGGIGSGERGRDTDGVFVGEAEAQAVGLVEVDGVGVEDLDVESPFFEVGGGDEGYAGGQVRVDLWGGRSWVRLLGFGRRGVEGCEAVRRTFASS